jgi:hypothetical protein
MTRDEARALIERQRTKAREQHAGTTLADPLRHPVKLARLTRELGKVAICVVDDYTSDRALANELSQLAAAAEMWLESLLGEGERGGW